MCFEITSDHSAGHWTAEKLEGGYYEARSRSIGLKKTASLLPVSFTKIGIGGQ